MLSPPDAEFHFDKIPVSFGVLLIGQIHIFLAVAVCVNYFCHGLKIHKGVSKKFREGLGKIHVRIIAGVRVALGLPIFQGVFPHFQSRIDKHPNVVGGCPIAAGEVRQKSCNVVVPMEFHKEASAKAVPILCSVKQVDVITCFHGLKWFCFCFLATW